MKNCELSNYLSKTHCAISIKYIHEVLCAKGIRFFPQYRTCFNTQSIQSLVFIYEGYGYYVVRDGISQYDPIIVEKTTNFLFFESGMKIDYQMSAYFVSLKR